MQNVETEVASETPAKGRMPSHRLWMVEDREGKPHWIPITGLWPTKKGALTGQLDLKTKIPAGARLVITLAKSKNGGGQ